MSVSLKKHPIPGARFAPYTISTIFAKDCTINGKLSLFLRYDSVSIRFSPDGTEQTIDDSSYAYVLPDNMDDTAETFVSGWAYKAALCLCAQLSPNVIKVY